MFSYRILNFVKFFIGILIFEGATVLLTYTALQTQNTDLWPLFAAVGASIGFLVTLWFESISGGTREYAMAQMQQRHAREREKIRLDAARDKARLEVKQTKTKSSSGGKLKTGIAVGGIVGIGVAMVLAQFVTVGLLMLSSVGGAALGYTVRMRQEKRQQLRYETANDRVLVAQESPRVLFKRRDADSIKNLPPS
ncbi:hypothetical protein [Thiospirillum jenense]|uniref:Uncharacterized protein n=1 Tax=Thiospirillum jenense TaxID=1653858 RepID=A0A839HEL1_9GAMM|nr:hypothetical protein [Thiospirillum jenense]MBB1126550.1 hypothetical protein [Thiospirillum jenense]